MASQTIANNQSKIMKNAAVNFSKATSSPYLITDYFIAIVIIQHLNLGWIGDPEDDLQVCFTARSLTDLHTIQISQSQLIKVDKCSYSSIRPCKFVRLFVCIYIALILLSWDSYANPITEISFQNHLANLDW